VKIPPTRLAAATGLVLLLASCGSGGGSAAREATTRPRPTTTTLPPTTTTTLPPYVSLRAEAKGPSLAVYTSPESPQPDQTLPNPWVYDPSYPDQTVPQVFLVTQQRPDGWVQVLLPVRPNGTTGWVHSSDVQLATNSYQVKVELGARQITVTDKTDVVYQGPVAIGAPDTPTPTGRYYIRVLVKAINPNAGYGPFAYGLSSHSDALETFDGGDAEIGIHGNSDASVLGHDISHGCIRMDNDAITMLSGLLPLGTPVDVLP
jgi:lipoprotein-anchoring transpeptidase ErfK/SrfK